MWLMWCVTAYFLFNFNILSPLAEFKQIIKVGFIFLSNKLFPYSSILKYAILKRFKVGKYYVTIKCTKIMQK